MVDEGRSLFEVEGIGDQILQILKDHHFILAVI